MMEAAVINWGTWEELVLGGAILRHGTQDWDAVAAELRARTLYPFYFTAEVCKAKYEDLQKRFRGLTNGWFEELRKHRVAELKRELEKSDDSIGSLQSKLETLKAEIKEDPKYGLSQIASPTSVANSHGVDFSSKETSKDYLSAGSFTEQAPTDWSPECQIPVEVSPQETETKPNQTEITTPLGFMPSGTLKKRRGKRKRKDCSINSTTIKQIESKEESTGDCDRALGLVDAVDQNDPTAKNETIDLMKILNLVMENKDASVFLRRSDSQKARYKKLIRRHMDFETVRSRISNRSITSVTELHRDLLLLCNNAIVFYARDSNEYRSAVSLRNIVAKVFESTQRVSGGYSSGSVSTSTKNRPVKPPAKPRSVRKGCRNVKENVVSKEIPMEESEKKECGEDVKVELTLALLAKKGRGGAGKGGRPGGRKLLVETPAKGRKRARRR